jgi:predicted dinucleotide-binding enzyme
MAAKLTIGILGSGNVGGSIGLNLGAKGYKILYSTRDPNSDKIKKILQQTPNSKSCTIQDAVTHSDILLLSTPWNITREFLESAGTSGIDFSGKILIDATNPLNASLNLIIGHSTSAGELVAGWAKGAKVVKAFNTIGFNLMENPVRNGVGADLHICGDDEAAKKAVSGMARDMGFVPVDVGGLAKARLTEPLAELWITLAMKHGRDHFFKYFPEIPHKSE